MEKQFLGRKTNYDLLRILSTVAVIFIHANWLYFKPIYETPVISFTWISMSLINILTRFSVPAFVMLSGAFILSNEQNANLEFFYKKSMKRIFLPTAFVIFILIFVQIGINVAEHNKIYHDLKGVFKGGFYNLWYIYMLAGLYFLTPFMIRLKKVISWKQYKVLTMVMILWAIVSQAASNQKLAYSIGVVFAFSGYFLLGDVLKTEIDKGWSPPKWKLIVISMACIAVSFIFRASGYNYYIAQAYINFFSPTMVVYSICVFLFFGMIKIEKDCSKLAGATFEIYLLHMVVLKGFALVILNMEITSILGEVIIAVGTFVITWLLAIEYKKLWSKVVKNKKFNDWLDNLRVWKIFS